MYRAEKKCENASVPDKRDNKDESVNIIAEDIFKRRVEDLEDQIQKLKSKAYYKSSNDQRSINIFLEKVEILDEAMEA